MGFKSILGHGFQHLILLGRLTILCLFVCLFVCLFILLSLDTEIYL